MQRMARSWASHFVYTESVGLQGRQSSSIVVAIHQSQEPISGKLLGREDFDCYRSDLAPRHEDGRAVTMDTLFQSCQSHGLQGFPTLR